MKNSNHPRRNTDKLSNAEMATGCFMYVLPVGALAVGVVLATGFTINGIAQESKSVQERIIQEVDSKGTAVSPPTMEYFTEDGSRVEVGQWTKVSSADVAEADLAVLGGHILAQDALGAAYYDLSDQPKTNTFFVMLGGVLMPISYDSPNDNSSVIELRVPKYADTAEDLAERELKVALDRPTADDNEVSVRLKIVSTDIKSESMLEVKSSLGNVEDVNLIVTVTDKE